MAKTKRKQSKESPEQWRDRQLERQLRRHAVEFLVHCDLIDSTGRAWPVTIGSVPDDGFFIGLLLIRPHSIGGHKFCSALKRGDVVQCRVGLSFFHARVASTYEDNVWLHAVDVSQHVIIPVCVPDPDNPRHANTLKKWGLANG